MSFYVFWIVLAREGGGDSIPVFDNEIGGGGGSNPVGKDGGGDGGGSGNPVGKEGGGGGGGNAVLEFYTLILLVTLFYPVILASNYFLAFLKLSWFPTVYYLFSTVWFYSDLF